MKKTKSFKQYLLILLQPYSGGLVFHITCAQPSFSLELRGAQFRGKVNDTIISCFVLKSEESNIRRLDLDQLWIGRESVD